MSIPCKNFCILAAWPVFITIRMYKDPSIRGIRKLGKGRVALDSRRVSLILEWLK